MRFLRIRDCVNILSLLTRALMLESERAGLPGSFFKINLCTEDILTSSHSPADECGATWQAYLPA